MSSEKEGFVCMKLTMAGFVCTLECFIHSGNEEDGAINERIIGFFSKIARKSLILDDYYI